MVFWPWIIGIGIGVVATLLTTNRAITYTDEPRRRKNRFVQDLDDDCSICREGMAVQRLNCGHALHKRCLEKLKQSDKRCPTCRAPITEREEPVAQKNEPVIQSNEPIVQRNKNGF